MEDIEKKINKIFDDISITFDPYEGKPLVFGMDEAKDKIIELVNNDYKFNPLERLLDAFGWQGGTIHQVIDEIKRLKNQVEVLQGAYNESFFRSKTLFEALKDCQDDVDERFFEMRDKYGIYHKKLVQEQKDKVDRIDKLIKGMEQLFKEPRP